MNYRVSLDPTRVNPVYIPTLGSFIKGMGKKSLCKLIELAAPVWVKR